MAFEWCFRNSDITITLIHPISVNLKTKFTIASVYLCLCLTSSLLSISVEHYKDYFYSSYNFFMKFILQLYIYYNTKSNIEVNYGQEYIDLVLLDCMRYLWQLLILYL